MLHSFPARAAPHDAGALCQPHVDQPWWAHALQALLASTQGDSHGASHDWHSSHSGAGGAKAKRKTCDVAGIHQQDWGGGNVWYCSCRERNTLGMDG